MLAVILVLASVLAVVGPSPAAAVPLPPRPPALREVIVVFKTHFDIGYTDLGRTVVERYRTTMIDQALAIVDLNRAQPPARRFAWTLPGWPLSQIASDGPGQKPDRLRRVGEAIRDGFFVVHALPFTTHTELLEPEDLVRGLGFASRLSRRYGQTLPRDAKMTDVPSHSWILPTLLRRAGVDFLHLGCNAASRSPLVPPLFWWQGPDGSRLLTMYSAEGYGTGLVPPPEWPHHTWLALIHTGDNEGPPKPEDVDKLLAEAAAKLPGVKVRIGRLSDFSDAILAENSSLPIVRGDMPDTWIHGPMSDPAGSMLARVTRPSIGTAEALDTLLGAWGIGSPSPGTAIAGAYEQSLLYGEHTWGGALYWVTEYGAKTRWGYGDVWKADRAAGRFRRLEESWAEHSSYIEKARDLVNPVLAKAMDGLAHAAAVSGPRVAVFNPLPWKRTAWVAFEPGEVKIEALKPADGGAPFPVVAEGREARFLASDIPALGYRVFVPAPKSQEPGTPPIPPAAPDPAGIENEKFKVVFDPARGSIRSIIDKSSGRELVDAAASPGFGQYLYERFDADQVAAFRKAYVKIDADWGVAELGKPNMPPAAQVPYRAATPKSAALVFARGAAEQSATMTSAPSAEIPHGVKTVVSLAAGATYIDIAVTLIEKPADAWPEAGWIALPFKVDSPRFRLGRLGSIVDPAQDIVAGTNRRLFAVNTGVALFNPAGRGVGLCAPDSALVSLDSPGAWKYDLDFVPQKPAVYVQLFNNQWTTNFRFWNEGTWTARVRIWAFDRYEAAASLVTPSLEARYPLLAKAADGSAGMAAGTAVGVGISSPGTLVTAFGPNPDGEGSILRFWELAGRNGTFTVKLPAGLGVETVTPLDLRGRPFGSPIRVKDGSFVFNGASFAPASFGFRIKK